MIIVIQRNQVRVKTSSTRGAGDAGMTRQWIGKRKRKKGKTGGPRLVELDLVRG